MEQQLKRLSYGSLNYEVEAMIKLGYIIKQISGSGDNYYVWVLFEKNISNENIL